MLWGTLYQPQHTKVETAMMKLSAAIIDQQKAALKAQQEKGDPRQKAQNKLPSIQQNITRDD